MTLVKYNNHYAPSTLSQFVDRFFHEENLQNKVYKFLPDVDLVEGENNFEIHAAIPGLTKEDFKIEVNNGILTLSGERKFVKEENKKTFKSVETNYGAFSRSFSLPDNVDINKIDAEYINGILKINIPKDENKKLKTSIVVK